MEDRVDILLTKIKAKLNSAPNNSATKKTLEAKTCLNSLTASQAIILGSLIIALACYTAIRAPNIKKGNKTLLISTDSKTGKGVDIYEALPDLSITVEGVVPLPPRYEDLYGI